MGGHRNSSHSQLSKKKTAMSSIETLSPGVAQSGVADQYADGVAAQNWLFYIGEQENRTSNYKNFLINTLKEKKCYTILDAADFFKLSEIVDPAFYIHVIEKPNS